MVIAAVYIRELIREDQMRQARQQLAEMIRAGRQPVRRSKKGCGFPGGIPVFLPQEGGENYQSFSPRRARSAMSCWNSGGPNAATACLFVYAPFSTICSE
jgi:hypothetical protein